MKGFLILTFFIGLTFSSIGQIVSDRVEKYVNNLQIDTFLIYSFPCSVEITLDSCAWDETHYLFWKQNGNYFIKRFDYCQNYKSAHLDTVNPLLFYFDNKQTIDKEEIKQPTYYEIKRKKNEIDSITVIESVDHSCYHKLTLHSNNKSKIKYANTYYLDFIKFDNGKKNIYYSYNQSTKLKALIDIITRLIQQFNGSKFDLE